MIYVVKTLHLLGLVLALGSGLTRLILGPVMMANDTARPALAPLMQRFASLNYAGLILLWGTGLWLYSAGYIGSDLGWAFHAKLAAVVALTAIAATVWLRGVRGTPVSPSMGRRLGMAAAGLAVLSVLFATIAFGNG